MANIRDFTGSRNFSFIKKPTISRKSSPSKNVPIKTAMYP
jgi:hypothetical protein